MAQGDVGSLVHKGLRACAPAVLNTTDPTCPTCTDALGSGQFGAHSALASSGGAGALGTAAMSRRVPRAHSGAGLPGILCAGRCPARAAAWSRLGLGVSAAAPQLRRPEIAAEPSCLVPSPGVGPPQAPVRTLDRLTALGAAKPLSAVESKRSGRRFGVGLNARLAHASRDARKVVEKVQSSFPAHCQTPKSDLRA